MTRDELQALAAKLPADVLYSAEAVGKHLGAGGVSDTAAATAYCIAQGWWHERAQFNVREIWRDSQPHLRATIQSAPRVPRFGAVAQTLSPSLPAKEKPQLTRKNPKPQQGGFF